MHIGVSLVSNSSVTCPGDTILFTCTQPGTSLQWRVDPPEDSGLMSAIQNNIFIASLSQVGQAYTLGEGMVIFEATFEGSEDGVMISILINLSEVSLLNGSIVTCTTTGVDIFPIQSQLTILSVGE